MGLVFSSGSGMTTLISSLIGLALAAAAPTEAVHSKISTGGQLAVEGCEFAEVYAHSNVDCQVSFFNGGEKPIKVFAFTPVISTGTVEPSEVVVAPHATGYVRINLNVENSAGASRFPFRFKTDEPGHNQGSVNVRGFVLSALDEVKPAIDFGVVNSNEPGKQSLALHSREDADFRITGILDQPTWLESKIAADGRAIEMIVKAGAPWGLQNGLVKLAINAKRQKEIWISVKVDVHGEIVPSANPIDMGLMRVGNRNEQVVRLNSKSGKDFKLDSPEIEGFTGDAKLVPCRPASAGCKMIRIKVSDRQPSGAVKGNIWLTAPDYKQKFPVALWGLLVPKDFKVQTLDATKAGAENKSPTTAAPDLLKELSKMSQQGATAMEPPPGVGPLLKWTVANGGRVFGFQIFRSESEGGTERLMDPELVRSGTDGNEPMNYQWRDTSSERGKAYWYSVRIVNRDGTMETLVTPHKIVAK